MYLLVRFNIKDSYTVYEDRVIYIDSRDKKWIEEELTDVYDDEFEILEYNYREAV